MTRQTRNRLAILTSLATLVAIGLSACDTLSSSGDSLRATDTGRLTVYLTDAPFPFDDAKAANVTVLRVELLGTDSTESVIVVDSVQSFNLLDLRNGVTARLATVDVPFGTYSQLRVIVADSASVVMKDERVFPLKVPSGSKTGIKVNVPEFDLDAIDDEAVITVDFNVERSFVVRGNPRTTAQINGFLFKPVLKIASFSINGVEPDTTGQG